jgi:elongation factor Ts
MAAISASMVKELRELTGLGMMECKKALTEADGNIEKAVEDLRKKSGLKAAKKAGRTAAEGILALQVAEDNSSAVLVEVNSETDFVARDAGFIAFADQVLAKAVATSEADVAKLMEGELEEARQGLVQKIGENISVRRVEVVKGAMVAGYIHSNNRVAAVVVFSGGDAETARDVAMHVTAVNPRVIRAEDMPAEVVEQEKDIIRAQPDMAGKPAEIVEKMMTGRINKFLKESSLVDQPFVKDPDQKVGQLVKSKGGEIQSFVRFEVGEGIEVEKKDFATEVAEQLKG